MKNQRNLLRSTSRQNCIRFSASATHKFQYFSNQNLGWYFSPLHHHQHRDVNSHSYYHHLRHWVILIALTKLDRRLGRLNLPGNLTKAMKSAPRIEISLPMHERVALIRSDYASWEQNPTRINQVLDKLVPHHGHAQVDKWREMVFATLSSSSSSSSSSSASSSM